jgi:hypothetical protein
MRASIFFSFFSLFGCGGNVVVDAFATSVGGGATAASTATARPSATSSSSGASCGGCSKTVCPMFPPTAGAACACCDQTCPYDQCPQDGSLTTATCINGTWSLESANCAAASPCGSTQCTPGFVCLHHIGGAVMSMLETCIPNPCGPSALACSCATSVCPTNPGDSCMAMGNDLLCACAACQ